MCSKRVILYSHGGLGNQLFQYAFARHLSTLYDAKITVERILGFKLDRTYRRKFELTAILGINFKRSYMISISLLIVMLLKKVGINKITNLYTVITDIDDPDQISSKMRSYRYIFVIGYFQKYEYAESSKVINEISQNLITRSKDREFRIAILIRTFNEVASKDERDIRNRHLTEYLSMLKSLLALPENKIFTKILYTTSKKLRSELNVGIDDSKTHRELLQNICNSDIIYLNNSTLYLWAGYVAQKNGSIINSFFVPEELCMPGWKRHDRNH